MLIIGSHVGYKKDSGLVGSVREALSYNANTFMFYTGAPQNTIRSNIDLDNVKEAYELMKNSNISKDNIIVHAPYIINLANPEKFDFSCRFLTEELKRVNTFGFKYLVLQKLTRFLIVVRFLQMLFCAKLNKDSNTKRDTQ